MHSCNCCGLEEQLIMTLPRRIKVLEFCQVAATSAMEPTLNMSVFGPWGMWCKRWGWSPVDSMAQLSSLWRDLGLNLVLRCLIGSALMWLSNQACCCFMALQRAASFCCERFSRDLASSQHLRLCRKKVWRVEAQLKTWMPVLYSWHTWLTGTYMGIKAKWSEYFRKRRFIMSVRELVVPHYVYVHDIFGSIMQV